MSLKTTELCKSYGRRPVVDGVDLRVEPGEIVGLLGPNGAGKTTTMRLLTGFYTPDRGRVLVGGLDNRDHDQEAKRLIGYLPENNPLYADMIVTDYLAFIADLRGMSRTERRGAIADAVDEAGVSEVYYRPIGQLSKGNRQRVGLAQAILHRPEILIMDEPTEGLDPNQRMAIRHLIRSLGEDRTVLLSTHVLGEVEATCDRVLVINRGRLVADNSVHDLLERAQGLRTVSVEVRGEGVAEALAALPGVASADLRDTAEGRDHYVITVSGDGDPRPEIFQLAKDRGWALWELHAERARLEDVFQALTSPGDEEPPAESGPD